MHKTTALFLSLATFISCVPEPKKAYSPDEIKNLDSLEELMRINANKADPLFGKRDQASFTDAELTEMAEAGSAIEASAKRLGEKFGSSYDDGFVDYANQLAGQAKALSDATAAKDAAGAGKALEEMRNTCKACHGVYR